MRKLLALILTLSPLVIATGCGGGGTTNNPPPPPPPPPPPQVIATPGPPNVESLVVDAGPRALTAAAVNTAFIEVTVCIPGTSTCQTIDHIEVDTGSTGLRILADATTTATGNPTFSLTLPAVRDSSSSHYPLAECLEFADGYSWGSVNTADITLPVSGKTATNVVVQVIGATSAGDPAKANPTCVPRPTSPLYIGQCKGIENTVPCFGANGILGVGPFVNDCSSNSPCPSTAPDCSSAPCIPAVSSTYYSCPTSTTCAQVTQQTEVPANQQVQNPAVLFATDNNGVIVELPAVGDTGAAAGLKGSLVFGIDTQSNNKSTGAGATKLPMCPGNLQNPPAICATTINGMPAQLAGTISATLDGTMYQESYLDSGSNANFFPTTSIATCAPQPSAPNSQFLCPASTLTKNAMLTGTDGTQLAADFSVANATSLFMGSNAAFSNLAGSNYGAGTANNTLDLGLSFFYGHNVFTGFENNPSGPYFAY